MQYRGKLLGLLIGSISPVPQGIIGSLVGLIIGHAYDLFKEKQINNTVYNDRVKEIIYFHTTFQVMGHLTKAKGYVSESDIQVVSAFMDQIRLDDATRERAQQAFRDGKASDYPLKKKLAELKTICFGSFDKLSMFIEAQVQVAFADGSLHPAEKKMLYTIAEGLGVPTSALEQILAMYANPGHTQQHKSDYDYFYRYQSALQRDEITLEQAYTILNVKVGDSAISIKRAYRKLMNENHPDKLAGQNLSPEVIELANQKSQEIQAAYNLVKQARKFK